LTTQDGLPQGTETTVTW